MKNCDKKFVIGFPVDAGEKTEPFYYLVLSDKNEFNQGVKSGSRFKKLESIYDSQMDHILKKLNEEKKYLVFISSSEKQRDLIRDALPDGSSSTVACVLAGYKEDINYENYSEESKIPILMISCSIYGTPSLKEAQLSKVTCSTLDISKNSLKRKWEVVKRINEKGTPVAFLLHTDDFCLIKEIISENEYEEASLDEIGKLHINNNFDTHKSIDKQQDEKNKSEPFSYLKRLMKESSLTSSRFYQEKPLLISLENNDLKKLLHEVGAKDINKKKEKTHDESIINTIFEEILSATSFEDIVLDRISKASKSERFELCKALKILDDSSIEKIALEYKSVAGNSFANVFRETELSYKEILVDVANKLKPTGTEKFYSEDNHSEIYIEDKIIEYFAKQIAEDLNKLNESQRKKKVAELSEKMRSNKMPVEAIQKFESTLSVSGTITVGTIVALSTGPITGALFYSGVFAGIWAGIFGMNSALLALTGTGVGIAVALPIFVLYLSSPSYRKTIPATLQLIGIRKRIESQTEVD